ncbi:hypothetical protein [Aquimarina sediminis]|uniref:hypothetical protein n=1 Tax=Aquimarina sediminis TaxID=2070536 RepID=UPI000CA0673D|nr:hypothetical protein [Aquimarina sediminis]
MSNSIAQEKLVLGGYSTYGPLTPEAKKVFFEVFPDGVHGNAIYTPLEVATQVVAGINFKYRCSVVPKNPTIPLEWESIVVIYKPLKGEPILQSINPI